ncbi:hypothetical protein [Kingella potus]|uniref:hypothetical protein n=1 Tax=Kingella potus TaxID=265175 RepID=UPI001FD541FE|nr:hypothetical protein [Kingella potus]UOP01666.1 hypothetical protein LVJ84_05850 [Kingella potus]
MDGCPLPCGGQKQTGRLKTGFGKTEFSDGLCRACGTATHAALGVSDGLYTRSARRIVRRVRRYGDTPYGG